MSNDKPTLSLDEQIALLRGLQKSAVLSEVVGGPLGDCVASLERLKAMEDLAEQAYAAGQSNGYGNAKGLEPSMCYEEWRKAND